MTRDARASLEPPIRIRRLLRTFFKSSEANGLADRANGDFVAVSREWFPQ